ncbi:hypothetical protein DRP77_05685 [Candidatus Poribacteria bacterium]|nr:MAG: hypothetical protein DRP77_05685 [Candidatus Poribacteria bacterium]
MKCWEERGCGRRECEGFGRETDFCWFRPERRCDRGGEGLSFKERFLNHCVECQVFADLLSSLQKEGSPALLGILKDIARRISMCDSALEGAPARLNWFADKITQLYELSTLMLSSLNVDRVLYIILTAVTSGQALGLNRAFLFTIDESEGALKGKMAVGPLDLSEASRIWSELSERQLTIQEIVEEYERHPPTEQNKAINEIIQRVSIPLDRTDSILVRSVVEKVSFNNIPVEQCADIEREFLRELKSTMITVVPLVAREKAIGALMVDNFVTNQPVSEEDLELLKLYANYAALAIVNASLYESLERKVRELEEAQETLRQKERQLIESEKFAAMGKMAASIAHEIKNPLVSIGGFARLVYRKVEDSMIKESLQIIINETMRLENLLQNILSFSRPPEPKLELKDLNELVRQVIPIVQQEVANLENEIKIEVDIHPGRLMVWFDEAQIKQVLLNLCKNAIQAMPEGGTLSLRTGVKGGFAQISVSDTGVGIPKEHLNSLFTPFFTTKSTGTGLGLSVAKQVVVKHGGFIDVESEENVGSTFTINLPIERVEDEG